jgi:hypothetical protein
MDNIESTILQFQTLGVHSKEGDVEIQPLVFLLVLVLKDNEGIAGVLKPSLSQLRIMSLTR